MQIGKLLEGKLRKVEQELQAERRSLCSVFLPTKQREYDRESILKQFEEEKRMYKKYGKDCTNITEVIVELDSAIKELFFITKFKR